MTDDPNGPVLVLVNAGSVEEAETIGARLVADGLAASVNIVPEIVSLYSWQDEPVRAHEAAMTIKTVRARVARIVALIGELHSYEVPSVLVVPVEGGNPAYLEWIARQAGDDPGR